MSSRSQSKNKKRIEIVFFGFGRMHSDKNVPDDVIEICVDYYSLIDIAFDVCCKGTEQNISEDGLTVIDPVSPSNDYHTYMASKGWNKGVHAFTLTPGKESSLRNIGIGVTSSEEIESCQKKTDLYFLWSKNEKVSGYCMDYERIFEIKNGHYNKKIDCDKSNFHGDPLTIVLDCDNWQIQYFSKEEAVMQPLDIIPNKAYHAAFSAFPSTVSEMMLTETPQAIADKFNL